MIINIRRTEDCICIADKCVYKDDRPNDSLYNREICLLCIILCFPFMVEVGCVQTSQDKYTTDQDSSPSLNCLKPFNVTIFGKSERN